MSRREGANGCTAHRCRLIFGDEDRRGGHGMSRFAGVSARNPLVGSSVLGTIGIVRRAGCSAPIPELNVCLTGEQPRDDFFRLGRRDEGPKNWRNRGRRRSVRSTECLIPSGVAVHQHESTKTAARPVPPDERTTNVRSVSAP